jgi:hypothetical protein
MAPRYTRNPTTFTSFFVSASAPKTFKVPEIPQPAEPEPEPPAPPRPSAVRPHLDEFREKWHTKPYKMRPLFYGKNVVYAMQMGPFIKVGFSIRDVESRMGQLQIACPLPLKLIDTFPIGVHPRRLEAFIHSILDEFRTCGEWFLCDMDDVYAAVEMARQLKPDATWKDFRDLAASYGADRDLGRSNRDGKQIWYSSTVERRNEVTRAFAAWCQEHVIASA